MNQAALRDHRFFERDFQIAAEWFFGRSMKIEERVLNVVSVWRGQGKASAGNPRPLHVWAALEKEVPLIQQLYSSLSIGPPISTRMGFPKIERRVLHSSFYDPLRFDWRETLISIFGDPTSADQTPSAAAIRSSGILTVRDLVAAMLDSRLTSAGTANSNFGRLRQTVLKQLSYRSADGAVVGRSGLTALSTRALDAWSGLCQIDPYLGTRQFVVVPVEGSFKVLPFAVLGGFNLNDVDAKRTWLARGNVLEPVTAPYDEPVGELERLINSKATEREFQSFFEHFPNFLSGVGPYKKIHSQLVLSRESDGKLIPDFFLEKIDSNFCDICDLKLPTADLVRHQQNRERFRDTVMAGVAQLTEYRDWFESDRNRSAFAKQYGIESYRPQAILVIGRKDSFTTDVQRLRLESNLPRWFQLLTYDDVLARARHWLTLRNA